MAQDGSIQVTIDGDTSDFDAKMEKTGKGIKEAFSGGGDSLGGMLNKMDSLAVKAGTALAVLKAMGDVAAKLNEFRELEATNGAKAGASSANVARSIRDLGGDQESRYNWATTADEKNGLSIENKGNFLGALAGVNKQRGLKSLPALSDAEIKRYQGLFEAGGSVAMGANGEDITNAAADPIMNFDMEFKMQQRNRFGGRFMADMTPEQMAARMRSGVNSRAGAEASVGAFVSGAEYDKNAQSFDASTTERRVNEQYEKDMAPGGRVGWKVGQLPIIGPIADKFGVVSLMESAEKSKIRDHLSGSGISVESWATSPSESIHRLISDQTNIMRAQSIPRPATQRSGDNQ
jgi:hypothetical protein